MHKFNLDYSKIANERCGHSNEKKNLILQNVNNNIFLQLSICVPMSPKMSFLALVIYDQNGNSHRPLSIVSCLYI